MASRSTIRALQNLSGFGNQLTGLARIVAASQDQRREDAFHDFAVQDGNQGRNLLSVLSDFDQQQQANRRSGFGGVLDALNPQSVGIRTSPSESRLLNLVIGDQLLRDRQVDRRTPSDLPINLFGVAEEEDKGHPLRFDTKQVRIPALNIGTDTSSDFIAVDELGISDGDKAKMKRAILNGDREIVATMIRRLRQSGVF